MESTLKYKSSIEKILKEGNFLLKIGPIVTKYINYNSKNCVINNKDLYTDVNWWWFNTYLNEYLNSFIFGIDFYKDIIRKLFIYITENLQFLNSLDKI